jgi:hypothetical protein
MIVQISLRKGAVNSSSIFYFNTQNTEYINPRFNLPEFIVVEPLTLTLTLAALIHI